MQGYRPPMNPAFPAALSSLINECWSQNPLARPNMTAVVKRLLPILNSPELAMLDMPEPGCCAIM